MRLVFVNHCHPDMPHVCALRLRKFAEALAVRGHQVVLLTETLIDQDAPFTPEQLEDVLSAHDWATPFFLAVKPEKDTTLNRLRNGELGWGVRQAVIVLRYLFESGLYGDWQKAAKPYLAPLARSFQPDVVWASFGNTGVWNIAQDVARQSRCPWVADIKDNWQNFIPKGLRWFMARRYQDAAQMTTFSFGQKDEADQWFHQKKTVLYSGFDVPEAAVQGRPESTHFDILLSGSIYRKENLSGFVDGLEQWLRDRSTIAKPVRFSYRGNDQQRVAHGVERLKALCKLDIGGFMPLADLIERQRVADVNTYIRMPGAFIFHHKLFELLAADRPVVVYPEEIKESEIIADKVGGAFYSCGAPGDVAMAFAKSEKAGTQPVSFEKLAHYAWQGQAESLETVLENVRRNS